MITPSQPPSIAGLIARREAEVRAGTLTAGELRMTLAPELPDLKSTRDARGGCVEIRYPANPGGLPILGTHKAVGEYLCTTLADVLADPREHAYVLALTTKNRLIAPPYLLAIGTDGSCSFNTKDVFRYALLVGARAIIVAHTHPSGSVQPSPDDHAITLRMHDAGRILDIEVLDHLILAGCHRTPGDPRWFSFREAGML